MSGFKRKLSREAQRLKDEIDATPVSPEEEAVAAALAEQLRTVLRAGMNGGHYDSALACVALADTAAWLGELMCVEKETEMRREDPAYRESRSTWLVFYVGAITEAMKGRHTASKEGN